MYIFLFLGFVAQHLKTVCLFKGMDIFLSSVVWWPLFCYILIQYYVGLLQGILSAETISAISAATDNC